MASAAVFSDISTSASLTSCLSMISSGNRTLTLSDDSQLFSIAPAHALLGCQRTRYNVGFSSDNNLLDSFIPQVWYSSSSVSFSLSLMVTVFPLLCRYPLWAWRRLFFSSFFSIMPIPALSTENLRGHKLTLSAITHLVFNVAFLPHDHNARRLKSLGWVARVVSLWCQCAGFRGSTSETKASFSPQIPVWVEPRVSESGKCRSHQKRISFPVQFISRCSKSLSCNKGKASNLWWKGHSQ